MGRSTDRRRVRGRAGSALAVVVVSGSCLLAGCAGQEQVGSPAARVSTWVSGANAGAAIGTLGVDSANVAHVLDRNEPPAAVRAACALLTTDAETAIGNLPTPDAQLTDDLDRAYQKAASAGDACYQGAGGDAARLAKSAAERAALTPLLAQAMARIEAVTGRTPSTSTTQPAGACGDPFGGCA